MVTRRNCNSFPPFRIDEFPTKGEAIDFIKRIEPTTPLISLGGKAPNEPLSYRDYCQRLKNREIPSSLEIYEYNKGSKREIIVENTFDFIDSEIVDEAVAAKHFAISWNSLNCSFIDPLLSDDVIYESQNVFEPLSGKKNVVDYLKGKMETVQKHGEDVKVFAELGTIMNNRPCVIMAQGVKSNLLATVLFTIKENLIKQIDICSVAPHPTEARRSGRYPR